MRHYTRPHVTRYHGTTTIAANTILVKFTYAGDTNGDGIINLDDYQVIDVNIVDGTATTIPLPEPSSFVLGFLGLLGLLLARRRRGQKS